MFLTALLTLNLSQAYVGQGYQGTGSHVLPVQPEALKTLFEKITCTHSSQVRSVEKAWAIGYCPTIWRMTDGVKNLIHGGAWNRWLKENHGIVVGPPSTGKPVSEASTAGCTENCAEALEQGR